MRRWTSLKDVSDLRSLHFTDQTQVGAFAQRSSQARHIFLNPARQVPTERTGCVLCETHHIVNQPSLHSQRRMRCLIPRWRWRCWRQLVGWQQTGGEGGGGFNSLEYDLMARKSFANLTYPHSDHACAVHVRGGPPRVRRSTDW